MSVGISEIVVIAVLVIIFFKPDKLPAYLKSVSKITAEVKNASAEITKNLNNTINNMSDTISETEENVTEVNSGKERDVVDENK